MAYFGLVLVLAGLIVLVAWPLLRHRRHETERRLQQPEIDTQPRPPAPVDDERP